MTKSTERTLTFSLFLVLTVVSAAIEAWTIYRIVEAGDFEVLKVTVSVINGGALAYLLRAFGRLVNKTFISKDLVDEEDLKGFFQNRLNRINGYSNITPDNKHEVFQTLQQEVLRLTEDLLKKWLVADQFELSIFTNAEYPEITAYYETGGQSTPRSKHMRDQYPEYYITSGYKVVELLKDPTHKIIVIQNTDEPSANYKFLNEKQKEKIKSTLLYCFCLDTPRALVVVCDAPGAIDKNDSRLKNLINAVGMAIKCDCDLSGKL